MCCTNVCLKEREKDIYAGFSYNHSFYCYSELQEFLWVFNWHVKLQQAIDRFPCTQAINQMKLKYWPSAVVQRLDCFECQVDNSGKSTSSLCFVLKHKHQ